MREANKSMAVLVLRDMDDRIAQVTLRTGTKEWQGGRDYEDSPICQQLGDTGISDLTSAKLEGMLAVMAPPNSFVCLKGVVMMIFDYLREHRGWHQTSYTRQGLPYGRALDCAHRIEAVLVLLLETMITKQNSI